MGSELDRLAQQIKADRASKRELASKARQRISFMEGRIIPLLDEAIASAVEHYQRLTEAPGLNRRLHPRAGPPAAHRTLRLAGPDRHCHYRRRDLRPLLHSDNLRRIT
jgi:hypothetical protein